MTEQKIDTEESRESLHMPWFLRRDPEQAKREHQIDIANGHPCCCCGPENKKDSP